MRIEIILLGIIGVVFLIDYVNKRKKNKSKEIIKVTKSPKISFAKKLLLLGLYILFGLVLGFIIDYLVNPFIYDDVFQDFDFYFFVKYQAVQSTTNYLFGIAFSLIIYYIIFIPKLDVLGFFSYLKKRKKNISISIIIISLLKLLIHYFIYTSQTKGSRPRGKDFAFHLDNLFIEEVWIFIPVTLLYCIIIWFFNHKIKAR